MTDDGSFFITCCEKCGKPTKFPIERPPQTAADLHLLRQRISDACPVHGELTNEEMEEAKLAVVRGEANVPLPVIAELLEIHRLRRGNS